MILWWSLLLPASWLMGSTSLPLFQSEPDKRTITVSTYNLWNVMFNWDVRKYRIAEMIREINPDVIGFQEVRADSYGQRNQLSDLQALLPYHRWKVFIPVQDIKRYPTSVRGLGWTVEGLGLLSRHPITNKTSQQLSLSSSPDKNKRTVLHASIKTPSLELVHISVVHLSYDKKQQCNNIAEIMKYLDDGKFPYSIVMGDFNIYKDFEEPMQKLLTGQFATNGGCAKSLHVHYPAKENGALYIDAWRAAHPGDVGLTFSNMPTPGFESRPDRILISKKWMQVQAAFMAGDGKIYRESYSSHVRWNRFTAVLSAAYLSYYSASGSACYHDCGPHGSCRCGVCVTGGNKNSCILPRCQECSADTYFYLRAMAVVFFVCALQFLYAALQVLLILNRKNQRLMESMGINCCLCYPGLYTESGNLHRSRWRFCRFFTKVWPCCKMPALFQITASSIVMVTIIFIALYQHSDILNLVHDVLPEEYFPSDHLLLTATIKLSSDGPIIEPI